METLEELRDEALSNLELQFNEYRPDHEFSDVLKYACFPPGKLFRSMLVYCLGFDTKSLSPAHETLAASIELHHTYTLIHDDLPSMDDDDERRGRAATHKKFGEWRAILAGDALLAQSFGMLSKLPKEKLPELLKIYHEHTGSRGLILGQVLDLSGEDKSLDKLLKIHELKTGRLIQLAIRGANILSDLPLTDEKAMRLGHSIGINFQLLDDLCELTERLNEHEKEINPFLHFEAETLLKIIANNIMCLRDICDESKLHVFKSYINQYMHKTQKILLDGFENLKKHVDIDKDQIKDLEV